MSTQLLDHGRALQMMAEGMAPKDVAQAFGVSADYVRRVRKSSLAKDVIEVPAWVPTQYVEDYRIIAVEDGEEDAAAYVRRKKRGNILPVDEVRHELQIAAPALAVTREAYLQAMADLKPAEHSVRSIIRIVAAVTGKTVSEVISHQREFDVTRARHIAMYICIRSFDLSLKQISRHFGNRDHTTMIYAKSRVAAVMDSHDLTWSDDAVALTQSIWNVDWRARKAA